MYWGGKSADVDAMFREYVRLYYGPAEAAMNAFFDFCEANWAATEKDKAMADTALALFDKAKSKANAASVHGKRLAQMDEFLNGLRNKSLQLGRMRGPVPVLRLVQDPDKGPVIDGKLDEAEWGAAASTGPFVDVGTGKPNPAFPASGSAKLSSYTKSLPVLYGGSM